MSTPVFQGAIAVGLVLLALLLPATAVAQEEEGDGGGNAQSDGARVLLRGFVTDASSGQALPGANVALLAPGPGDGGDTLRVVRGAAVDGDGFYQIAGIPAAGASPGRYLLRVSYVGFVPQVDTLRLAAGQRVAQRNVALRPAEEALEAVTVTQEGGPARVEAGRQRIRPEDLGRIPTPGPTGDLASYLQTLPGVVSLGDRGGALYVRGGAPSQNQVMMDKMLLYRPFHIVGFFSAFPQDLISGVDFYAGGFGARYAERISSVIDVTMRGGNQQAYGGAVSLSPFLSSVRAEGPLRRGDVSFLVSIRQSTIEETAPLLLGEEQPLTFGEQMVKIQNTGATGQCSLTGLHTYDRGRLDPDGGDVFAWQNYGLGGRCLTFSEASPLTTEVDFGLTYFENTVGGSGSRAEAAPADERFSSIWRLYTNVDFSRPWDAWAVDGGFRVRVRRLRYDLQEQYQGLRSGREFFISGGGYVAGGVTLGEVLDLRPSLAANAALGESSLGLQPRLRATWRRPLGLSGGRLSGAVGLYEQLLAGIRDERDAGSAFTAWTLAPFEEEEDTSPRALHVLLGWQQRVAPGLSASVEGYYKDIAELPVPLWDTNARFTTTLGQAAGTVYGLDARATFERGPFYAYLGYGLARTRYALEQADFGRWFGQPVQSYFPPHDQRHQLSAVASYARGPWQASVRWQYGSGRPFTPPVGFDAWLDLRELPDVRNELGTPRFLFERPYGGRLPAYHRLDASIERSFDLGGTTRLAVKAGAINAYDRRNVFYLDLFAENGRFRRVDQLPFVPYLALTLKTL